MPPGSPELGKAYVSIEAETTDFDRKINEAARKTEKFADAADKSSKKARRSFGKVSEELQATLSRQAGVVTGFIGIAAAVAGIGVAAFKTGRQIRQAFTTKEADDFRSSIDPISDSLNELADAFAEVGRSGDSAFQANKSVADEFQKSLNDVSDALEAGLSQRSLSQLARDTQEFGLAGFFGSRSELIEKAEEEANDIIKARKRAIDEGRRALERDARDAANASIESAQALVDKLFEPPDAIDKAIEPYRKAAEELERLREDANNQVAANIDAQIGRLNAAAAQAADTVRATQDAEREAQAEAFREEAEAIRRESLDPVQQQVSAVEDRIGELRELLNDNPATEIRDAINSLIEANNNKLDQIRREAKEQSEQQSRDTIEGFRRVIDESAARFGLDQIFQQLAIVAQNTRPD